MQVAHEKLLSTVLDLQRQDKRAPTELMRALMLLHSYILVKTLVRMGDHQVTLYACWRECACAGASDPCCC